MGRLRPPYILSCFPYIRYLRTVKTTLVLDDDLYRQAKVMASGRGCTVSSLVEDALRLLMHAESVVHAPEEPMPAWDLGRPRIDIDDNRVLRDALDAGQRHDALR